MESKYLDLFKSYCVFADFGLGGCGCGWMWGTLHAHVHTHAHTHMHMCTHTCMHAKHDKHGCLHGGGHLQFPNMFILAFRACAWMHVHAHMSRDTPHAPRFPPTHLPLPRATGSPNHQKFISPELIKIIQFFTSEHSWTHLDSLWSP